MRRFLAILCTLFVLCSSLNLAVFATDGATENLQETSNTVVLEADAEDLEVAGGSTLDLNGYSVNNLSVRGGGTLLCTAQTVQPTTTR